MAFRDTKKENDYHSLFIKLFGHVWGGGIFSGHGVDLVTKAKSGTI